MLKRIDGIVLIMLATAVAGVVGYAVTWLVYRQIGPANYAVFAVFWAALYLVIGGLSGIQQEITRATHPIASGIPPKTSHARNFAAAASIGVFVLVLATAPAWSSQVFPNQGWALVWPLAIGAAAYVFIATLSGSLYGLVRWRPLALLIAADGIVRLALLGVVLTFTHNIVFLAWAVAIPFPLVLLILWPWIKASIVGQSVVDVGYRALSWNVTRTVLASISTAVLVSGFPLLLGVTAQSENQKEVGELIFTITLTRAPLIVTVMSLQSYFVVRFRDQAESWWSNFLVALGVVLASATILAGLGWWLGPTVLEWVSGRPVFMDGSLIAILVGSSALVAVLSLTAPAVLAKSQHFVYSLGWAVAAVVTIVIMVLPLEFVSRVALALLLGPIAGIIVHVSWLVFAPSTRRALEKI